MTGVLPIFFVCIAVALAVVLVGRSLLGPARLTRARPWIKALAMLPLIALATIQALRS